MKKFLVVLGLLINTLSAVPPKEIPSELWDDYTLKGQIPVYSWYFDDTYSTPKVYGKELFQELIQKAQKKECYYYGETDNYLYDALDDLQGSLKGQAMSLIIAIIAGINLFSALRYISIKFYGGGAYAAP